MQLQAHNGAGQGPQVPDPRQGSGGSGRLLSGSDGQPSEAVPSATDMSPLSGTDPPGSLGAAQAGTRVRTRLLSTEASQGRRGQRPRNSGVRCRGHRPTPEPHTCQGIHSLPHLPQPLCHCATVTPPSLMHQRALS